MAVVFLWGPQSQGVLKVIVLRCWQSRCNGRARSQETVPQLDAPVKFRRCNRHSNDSPSFANESWQPEGSAHPKPQAHQIGRVSFNSSHSSWFLALCDSHNNHMQHARTPPTKQHSTRQLCVACASTARRIWWKAHPAAAAATAKALAETPTAAAASKTKQKVSSLRQNNTLLSSKDTTPRWNASVHATERVAPVLGLTAVATSSGAAGGLEAGSRYRCRRYHTLPKQSYLIRAPSADKADAAKNELRLAPPNGSYLRQRRAPTSNTLTAPHVRPLAHRPHRSQLCEPHHAALYWLLPPVCTLPGASGIQGLHPPTHPLAAKWSPPCPPAASATTTAVPAPASAAASSLGLTTSASACPASR